MPSDTPSSGFTIPKWGPKKLREIHKLIESRLNSITPTPGLGIKIDQVDQGSQISVDEPDSWPADLFDGGNGSGGSGIPIDVYGAYNGAPAVFHLLQSSPPSAP